MIHLGLGWETPGNHLISQSILNNPQPILWNNKMNFLISPKKNGQIDKWKNHSESPSNWEWNHRDVESSDIYSSRINEFADLKKPSLVWIKDNLAHWKHYTPVKSSKLKEYKNYVINLKQLNRNEKNSASDLILPNLSI